MTATSEKSFKDVAKRFKAKANHVLAVKHEGAPKQVQTEHGAETAYDGDYIVQVGELEQVETIPPNREKGVPGGTKVHKAPKFEVMKASDFLALYDE